MCNCTWNKTTLDIVKMVPHKNDFISINANSFNCGVFNEFCHRNERNITRKIGCVKFIFFQIITGNDVLFTVLSSFSNQHWCPSILQLTHPSIFHKKVWLSFFGDPGLNSILHRQIYMKTLVAGLPPSHPPHCAILRGEIFIKKVISWEGNRRKFGLR